MSVHQYPKLYDIIDQLSNQYSLKGVLPRRATILPVTFNIIY